MMSADLAILALEPEGTIEWGSSQLEDYNPTIAGFPATADMLDGRAVPYRTLDPEALADADDPAPAAIISPWRHRFSPAACAALRRYVEAGGLLIGIGEQGYEADGSAAGMALADLFGLQPMAAAGDGPTVGAIEFGDSPLAAGLPPGAEARPIAPVNVTRVPGQCGALGGRSYRACGDAVAVASWRARDAGSESPGDFCVYRQVGRGAALWLDDALGVSLFLRCQRVPWSGSPALDDLEPVVWRLLCNAMAAHGLPLVFAVPTPALLEGGSPQARSFSVSHDVCANPWEEGSLADRVRRLAEFERRSGLRSGHSTWYLRTASPGGHMTHPRLRPTAIPPAQLIALVGDGDVGYHGEQFGWVKMFRCSQLKVAECYQREREELERLAAAPVISGSTHFGNFGERYPLDFEGAAAAGFLLWRNSYKRCGLTPMRPYRLPTAGGGQIAGILGYLDAISEDVAARDITSRALSSATDKALAWLEIAGGGHLFLHAHAIQFSGLWAHRDIRSWLRSSAAMVVKRQPSSGRARYRRACRLAHHAGLAGLSHRDVVRHRQQLDLLRLQVEALPEGLAARVQSPFAGLTLATLDPRPLTVSDENGDSLGTVSARDGDWQRVTVTGMPAARVEAAGLAETVAVGAA
jgi:hypothetical protein